MSNSRVVFTFCDDVRNEANGKISVMGVYRGYMAYPDQTPFLPKFSCLVQIDMPRSAEPGVIQLKLLRDDAVLVSAEIPAQGFPVSYGAVEAGLTDRVFLNVPMELVGQDFPNGAQLRAQCTVAGETFESEQLRVVRMPAAPAKAG